MTIADVVGNMDVYSAAVTIALGGGLTIVVTTALARTPRKKLEMDFKLAEIKLKLEHEEKKQDSDIAREKALAQIASTREIEFKRIDNGMIDVKTASRHPENG